MSATELVSSPEDSATHCIECRNTIRLGATICEHCDSYQSRWKNTLKYVSGVAGVLSAVAAATVYLIGAIPEIRQAYAWHDKIQVLQFSSNRGLTLLNEGDGGVYVSHVDLKGYTTDGKVFFRRTFPVAMTAEKGKVLERLPEMEGDPRMKGHQFRIVATADNKVWEAHMESSAEIDKILEGQACVLRAIYFEDEPRLQNYRESLGKTFRTFRAEARVHYQSIQKSTKNFVVVPVVGVLLRSASAACMTEAKLQ